MIIRARNVLPMNGAPIEDGAVVVRGNKIESVGKFSARVASGSEVVDLGDSILLPGLINAHCHLDYTCLRGKIPAQESFTDWIRAINAAKSQLTAEDYLHSIADGLAEAQRFGTTAMANLAAFPELIAQSAPVAMRTWWFPELIDVVAPDKSSELLATAIENLLLVRKREDGTGLAPHALFTASRDLFLRCEKACHPERSREIPRREVKVTPRDSSALLRSARNDRMLLTTHLAESREEMEMFRGGSGKLFDFLKTLGRPMNDCGGKTPLELFVGYLQEPRRDSSASLRSARNDGWIVAHLNELSGKDFDLLEGMTRKFSIAHCPRSHAYFGHSPFEFEKLVKLGFNICLATDSLASNDDLSLLAEARQFQKIYPTGEPEKVLRMITVHPGRALSAKIGQICTGFFADLIALPSTEKSVLHEAIIDFSGTVPWRMIDGEVQ